MDKIGEPQNTKSDRPRTDFTKLSPLGLGIGASMVIAFIVLAAIAPKAPIQRPPKAATTKQATIPANYDLSLVAKQVSNTVVEMEISTNLPPPVEVMVGITMTGLKDEDTWVGYNERIKLTSAKTTHLLNIAQASKPLPNTSYMAEVQFFPSWGAGGNSAAQKAPELQAKAQIELQNLGSTSVSAISVIQKNERRKWVMENVNMRMPWDEKKFVAKLGDYEKSPASMSPLHDAYYFSNADMTLVVNRVRNEVTVWRDGRNSN